MTTENFPKKICLIHGNQQLLVDETAKNIMNQILNGRDQELCLERFNVEEMLKSSKESGVKNIDDFFLIIDSLPMLSDLKIIRIDNFDFIKKTNKKNNKFSMDRFFSSVEKIIDKPPESIWFIFTSSAMREKDFSKPLYAHIKKKWRIQKFVSYDNNSPLNWVVERGEKKGLPMSLNVARLIIDIVGNDLSDLDHELEKLTIYLSRENITEDLIKKHIRGHKHFSIFRMTEALSQKELLPALEILDNQLKTSPREHVRILSLIVLQFRRILIIHSMFEQLLKESEILRRISLPPFLAKQLLRQAKNFNSEEIKNIYSELANLDLRIKFKSSLAPLLLQDLFQRICSGKFEN